MKKILMIDNFDSFTYNLVQGFRSLGADVEVFRNNAITIDEAKAMAPDFIVVSPGPGRPSDAGISMSIIESFAPIIPILGVCLGHQCIVEVFGGEVTYAKQLMHGKTSEMTHDEQTIFKDLETPMIVGRYHSLSASEDHFPKELTVSATTMSGEIMAVRHNVYDTEGVQFHPESIMTSEGMQLMANFLNTTNRRKA
jgi:anthranilate synthase/aminodeoxychorismate synthase-like glutamine amidotransferase